LGGSSISQFFQTVGGEQQEQVRQAEIQEACNNLKDEINRNYCEKYVPTDYTGETNQKQVNGETFYLMGGTSYDSNAWGASPNCGVPDSRLRSSRRVTSKRTANESGSAYEQTASQADCDWNANYFGFGQGPTVEVNGNQYSCIDEGYISETTCPAG
ncbi:MAG: hypothetical protein SVW77_03470, partial [Candidatus Nanohaloarchaea archaeon]|nr:hypothetical protein [Candidatus Nanohaloarchaea archaeon]